MATKTSKNEAKAKKLKVSRETLRDLSVTRGDVKGGMPVDSKWTQCGQTPGCYKPNPY